MMTDKPVQDKMHASFHYANECDLEIHCSPFGLSGLYIKINGTNLMGIGSAMGLITGNTRGLIHYNDGNDFVDRKYKMYVIVDDDGMLRIDFTKIYTSRRGSDASEDSKLDKPDKRRLSDEKDKIEEKVEEVDEEDQVPTLIFRGRCPEGRPDNIEPFIGIVSFERED